MPVRLARGEEEALKKDISARAAATTAPANSTHIPWFLRKFFKEMPPKMWWTRKGPYWKKATPNCSSIRDSRKTGRPMTLKKSPSSFSTKRAPLP